MAKKEKGTPAKSKTVDFKKKVNVGGTSILCPSCGASLVCSDTIAKAVTGVRYHDLDTIISCLIKNQEKIVYGAQSEDETPLVISSWQSLGAFISLFDLCDSDILECIKAIKSVKGIFIDIDDCEPSFSSSDEMLITFLDDLIEMEMKNNAL